MRRASTCLALLGLAVLAYRPPHRRRRRSRHRKGRTDPGLPAHRQHPRRRCRRRRRISRSKAPNPPAAFPSQLIGVKFYLPTGTKLHPQGFVDLLAGHARKHRTRAVPEEVAGEPCRHGRLSSTRSAANASQRTRRCKLLRARRAAAVLHQRRFADLGPADRLDRPLRQHPAPPYGPEFVGHVKLIVSVPGAPPVSTETITSRSAPRTSRARRRSTTARCRRSARRAASR